jgi:hypothetical protein
MMIMMMMMMMISHLVHPPKHTHTPTNPPAHSDCYWTLENEGGEKFVSITLSKRNMGYQSWDSLLESERVDLTITDRVRV